MSRRNESIAQFIDRFLIRTALGVLMVAIAYGLAASMYLVSPAVGAVLDLAELVLALGAVVVVLPVFVKLVRLRSAGVRHGCEPEGFISLAFQKASTYAFSLTFVVLMVLEPLTGKYWTNLPTPFFINLVLFISLGIFSIGFFSIAREEGAPEDEFGEGE